MIEVLKQACAFCEDGKSDESFQNPYPKGNTSTAPKDFGNALSGPLPDGALGPFRRGFSSSALKGESVNRPDTERAEQVRRLLPLHAIARGWPNSRSDASPRLSRRYL